MSRVSVVIPSYQQAEFLRQTLQSVCSQGSAEEVEIIVQDGGSTDGSVEILKEYGDRILWSSGPDGGQTAAINLGLKRSSGAIVCYLNSDDLLAPGALRKAVEFFAQNPEVELMYGNADLIDEKGVRIGEYPVEPWNYLRLSETCFISQPACFWRRSVHERVGWFDESLYFSMDYDFWLRVGKEGRVVYLPETLAIARRHREAKTVKTRAESFEEAFCTALRHLGRPMPRRWVLALAQARAERRLVSSGWLAFVTEYMRQARTLRNEFGCREPFRLVRSVLPHCMSAWKKVQ